MNVLVKERELPEGVDMAAAENDVEVQETKKAAKELRLRRSYIKQRLAEIHARKPVALQINERRAEEQLSAARAGHIECPPCAGDVVPGGSLHASSTNRCRCPRHTRLAGSAWAENA